MENGKLVLNKYDAAKKGRYHNFDEILQGIKFDPFDCTELFIRLLRCKNGEVGLDLMHNP